MNLNKDYLITVDIKSTTVNTPGNMSFYITDIKTANIFAQLVFNESNSTLITRYAPIENAEDFYITLRVIKPNNQFMEAKFTLLNQLEAFFMVDLTDEFKDYVGTYKCELFVDSKVNGELERITTASFRYKVLGSIANSLDDVIEGDPDYPILDDLMDRIEAMNPDYYATNANLNMGLSGKANKNHTHDEYATNESVNEAMDGVPGMISAYLTGIRDNIALASPFKMQTKTDSPLDIRTVVNTESDIMNIEYPYVGMIVYVRDTGKRYEVLTLAPKEIGFASVADACVGTYREPNYADKDHTHDELSVNDDFSVYGQASIYNNLRVSGVITQETAPTNDNDLTTKRYVDDSVANVPSMFAMEIVDGDLIVSYPDNSSSNIEFRINDNGELEANIND